MGELTAGYEGSELEKANQSYYKAEKMAERAVQRRDNARLPIVRSVLSAVARFREWQLEGAEQEVQEISDKYYYRSAF